MDLPEDPSRGVLASGVPNAHQSVKARALTRGAIIVLIAGAAVALAACGSSTVEGGQAPSTQSTSPSPSSTTAASSTTSAPTASTTEEPRSTTTVPAAAAAIDQLVVAVPDPSIPRYDREAFSGGEWSYNSTTGCNTRELVLIQESLEPPVLNDRCHPQSGHWYSTYDGVTTTDPDDLQIDHLVPVADAWRSGAYRWTDEQRTAFYNDIDEPATLIAVTGRLNTSKSDSTPDQWLPPNQAAWCDYLENWVAVKVKWKLSVTPAEKAAIVQKLQGCGP